MDKKSKMKKPLIILGSILGGLIAVGLIFGAMGSDPINRATGLFGFDTSGGSQQTDPAVFFRSLLGMIISSPWTA